MQLSKHFTLEEACFSSIAERFGIDNSCKNEEIINTAKNTANEMEIVRAILGYAIHIDSWIRCLDLNRTLQSKDDSQHVIGEAVDFICSQYGNPIFICKNIIRNKIRFDQMILEHTWVHISFKKNSKENRNNILTLLAKPDPVTKKRYTFGLTDKYGVSI